MFTEWAVRSRAAPMASATPMKRLLNSSSVIGSALSRAGLAALARPACSSTIIPSTPGRAVQPGETAIWVSGRMMSAGPSTRVSASAAMTGASCHAPWKNIRVDDADTAGRRIGAPPPGALSAEWLTDRPTLTASASTEAMTIGSAGSMKPNRRLWASSKAAFTASIPPNAAGSSASAPS